MTGPLMEGRDFLINVLRPTLIQLDMYSLSAEKLLYMTAAHESMGFRHRRQIEGPALSFFQIEPATFKDLWFRYLEMRPELKDRVRPFLTFRPQIELEDYLLDQLENNDAFACAIARIKYWTIPAPLPAPDDLEGMAYYAKMYYNTPKGKATQEKYLNDFTLYAPDPPPTEWVNVS